MKLGRFKYFKTSEELKIIINGEVSEALQVVGDKALERLDEIILRDVYTYDYFPNIRYYGGFAGGANEGFEQPTFEFRYAWEKFIEAKMGGTSELSIKYDSSQVGSAHNSIVTGTNVSKYLAQILNVDGFTSGLMVGIPAGVLSSSDAGTQRNVSKYRQPYWTNFMKEMSQGRKIRNWLKAELKSQGLDVS